MTAVIVGLCFGGASLIAGSSAFLDSATFTAASPEAGVALLGFLATVNVFLLVFNIIPAFPLDGGRIARAAIWKATGDRHRATRLSGRIGVGFAYLLGAAGIVVALRGDTFNGIWLLFLAFFLGQGAKGAVVQADVTERMDGITAADLMDTSPVTVPAALPAVEARDTAFDRYEALDPRSLEFGVPAQTSLEELLGSEPLRRLGALLVVAPDGRLQGVVSVERVRRALAAAVPAPG